MTKLIQVGNRNRKNGNGSRRGSFQVGGGVRGGGARVCPEIQGERERPEENARRKLACSLSGIT